MPGANYGQNPTGIGEIATSANLDLIRTRLKKTLFLKTLPP